MHMLPFPGKTMFLHCCARWLLDTDAANEITSFAFLSEKNMISTIWGSDSNPVPAALVRGFQAFDAAYVRGIEDRPKD